MSYGASEKHINELAAEVATKGVGRPEVDNEAVIEAILSKPETREQFFNQIAHLVNEKKGLVAKQDIYKDDVKATKEAFGLNGSYITAMVDAAVKDKVKKKSKETSALTDLLQMLDEHMNKDKDLDEDFE